MDLWDNQAVNEIRKKMDPKELEKYQKIGEHMFSFDFENTNFKSKSVEEKETLVYILIAIKSGLDIDMLEESEKFFLETLYGDNWRQVIEDLIYPTQVREDNNITDENSIQTRDELKSRLKNIINDKKKLR